METSVRVKASEKFQKETNMNTIEVEVYYTKGGYNYFTSREVKRGLRLNVKPMNIGGGMASYVILGNERESGGCIMLEELSRKSQKKQEKYAKAILPHAEEIAKLFEEGNNPELYRYVEELAKAAH